MKDTEWLCREASPYRVGIQFWGFALVRPVYLTQGKQPSFLADSNVLFGEQEKGDINLALKILLDFLNAMQLEPIVISYSE